MLFTIIRYIPLALINLVGIFLAVILAPFASLFYTIDAQGNEYLSSFWQWCTTHDASVNTYTLARGFEKDNHFYLGKFTYEQILNSSWLRYVSRVIWIWRNPAYQLAHWLGYNQVGVVVTKHAESDSTWDTGKPSYAYWTAVNTKGGKSFLWERQIYYYKNRCLELQFGWKLYREDPDQVCMLAFRITPFKKYG